MITIKTADEIKQDILSNISNEYEKSQGNLTHDIPAAVAIAMSNTYDDLKSTIDRLDVDNYYGDDLTEYVKERAGVIRNKATKTKALLTITGTAAINTGDLFETKSGTQFASLETKEISDSGTILAQAVIAGESGMVGANTITLMPVTIQGVVSVTNQSASYDGFAEESDLALKIRYKEKLLNTATSGNVFHYLEWAKAVDGVGDARVVSLWNGDNTVKVIIIDANKEPASQTLIDEVQTHIDPKGTYDSATDTWSTWGVGAGEAPIGAYTTVISATGVPVNITVDVQEGLGYTLDDVKANIQNNVTEYLREIAFKQDYISYAIIGSVIINTTGVADYQNLLINGDTGNVTVGYEEVATLGTLTVS